ncbi:MAG: calcium-binding protein [Beijerinckiaceae bacterium]
MVRLVASRFSNFDQSFSIFDLVVPLSSGTWTVNAQSATSVVFGYSSTGFRTYTNAEITITGINFQYTHNYAGYNFAYIPGTILDGTATDVSVRYNSGSVSPVGSTNELSISTFSELSQSLLSIINTGFNSTGDDYITGGVTVQTSSGIGGSETSYTYNQRLTGGGGNDTILGLDGNDTIEGGQGADYLYGGVGSNTLSYISALSGVYVHLALAISSDSDTILNFKDVLGTWTNDTLAGDAQNNALYSFGGNDIIAGGAGIDTLSGGDGNDTIYAEGGDDALFGDGGFDILSLDLASVGQSFQLGPLSYLSGATITGSISGFEGVIGSAFADTLFGTAGIDAISGGKGSDVIVLGGGVDYINIAGGDVVAGQYDYIADFTAGDSIFMPTGFSLYVYESGGITYAIANAAGGGYWGMSFGGGASVATVEAGIFYY